MSTNLHRLVDRVQQLLVRVLFPLGMQAQSLQSVPNPVVIDRKARTLMKCNKAVA